MKGKILGVAAVGKTGVITGQDDKRYRYEIADWRGAADAAPGQEVDFETGPEGQAMDIYPALGRAALPGLSLDQSKLSPFAANAIATARTNPFVWAAGVALIASLFLTYLSISLLPSMSNMGAADAALVRSLTGDTSIIGLADKVGSARDLFKVIETQAGAMGAAMGSEELGVLKTVKGLSGFLVVFYLAYLTPLLAGAVLWFELTGKSDRRVVLGLAASCLVSFALVFLLQMQVSQAIKDMVALMGGADMPTVVSGSDFIKPGLGAWALLLTGLATLGLRFNLIRLRTT
jgi:hypothetical protein